MLRLVVSSFLADRGELANLLFIFTSDNGAEASGATDIADNRWSLSRQGYSIDESTLGTRGSFNAISLVLLALPQPARRYKFHAGKAACACRSLFLDRWFGQRMRSHAKQLGSIAATNIGRGRASPKRTLRRRPILPMTEKPLAPPR